METEISELESRQGATTSADLSWQELHVEVIDPKSSVASAEEERLAAGVSTIRLHTKRLSGVQWRKLTRERKMMDGTWTERKPPRNTLSPSDRSVVGSSGGVKIPHMDLSTLMLERQQLKKPRNISVQTGSYKEAVGDIKIAIIHRQHPEIKLDQTQANMIQAKLLVAVDPLKETLLQYLHSKFAQGVLWIPCAKEFSQAWLMRAVSELGELWEGVELTVIDSNDLPKRPRVLVRIPNGSEVTTVLTHLRAQNSGLDTTDWTIMSRKVNDREQKLAHSIDPDFFKTDSFEFQGLLGIRKSFLSDPEG
jgi:hypothetical protein